MAIHQSTRERRNFQKSKSVNLRYPHPSIQPLTQAWKINCNRTEVNSYEANFIVKLIAKLIFIKGTPFLHWLLFYNLKRSETFQKESVVFFTVSKKQFRKRNKLIQKIFPPSLHPLLCASKKLQALKFINISININVKYSFSLSILLNMAKSNLSKEISNAANFLDNGDIKQGKP